ncbi:energy transducer TonB [Polaromonas sp. CT11-55]|uniref:energy transducer TonB family protein n=1 Tax=Polaromonas sp. CT11-55 TaxID=3243045 RepID=UPI0039A735FD
MKRFRGMMFNWSFGMHAQRRPLPAVAPFPSRRPTRRYAANVLSVVCAIFVSAPMAAPAEGTRHPSAVSIGPGAEQTEREIAALKRKRRAQLEALKKQLQTLPPPPERRDGEPSHVTERREKYFEFQRTLAEIERRILVEERTTVGWQKSVDPVVRSYYDRVRIRIESQGNKDFPKEEGKSLYGRVEVSFEVLPQGTINNIVTAQATSEALAAHAVRIIEAAAPFEPFPPALAKKFDRVVISAPFNYSKE